jgi:hypothetical protein
MPKGGKQPGAGRPKGSLAKSTIEAMELRKRLIEAASAEWDMIIRGLLRNATRGDVPAIRELFDRIFGKASQPLEHTGKDGKELPTPILINMNVPAYERDEKDSGTQQTP